MDASLQDKGSSDTNDNRFNEFIAETVRIKEELIDPIQEWYANHHKSPFYFFRIAGIVTILFGVTLPAVAVIPEASWDQKTVVLSIMSVTIAALTGLSSFFRWERSWKGRQSSHFAIEVLVAKWQLELQNARLIVEPSERLQHAYQATSDLIVNFRTVGATEEAEFFSGMQFPASRTGAG